MCDPSPGSGRRSGRRSSWLVLLFSSALLAQQLNLRQYGQEDGLANLVAQCMLQDRQGFLWVGTQSGLFRYDGSKFRAYFTDSGLPSAWIGALHETADGTLWVATRMGVAWWTGDRFQAVPGGGEYEILGRASLASDARGTLYVATSKGLMMARAPHGALAPVGLETGPLMGVYLDADGSLWLACRGRILHVDRNLPHPAVVSFGPAEGLPDRLWSAVLRDRQGNLWVRSPERLVMLPRGGRRFVAEDRGLPLSAYDNAVLYLDAQGRLVAPTDRGLAVRQNDRWDLIDSRRGLPASSVGCFLEDREGSVWIGLSGSGVVRWVGSGQWETWTVAQGLRHDSVWSIRRDASGTLWVGTDYGLNYLPRGASRWRQWNRDGLDGSNIRALALAGDGSLWLSTGPSVVAHLDPRTGALHRYGTAAGLTGDKVMNLAIDDEGRVWVATRAGLFRADRTTEPLHFELQSPPEGEPHESFTYVFRGADGVMWAGGNRGLARFAGGRWTRFTARDGLRISRVAFVTQTADGDIWLCYREDRGLSRLSFRGGRLEARHFTTADGLRSNHGIILRHDTRGWIWFGTDNGVDVFDGRSWHHYGRGDGLAWDDCDADSFLADEDGTVWIGTSRGLSHFFPSQAARPARATPALVTAVTFGRRSVSPDLSPEVAFTDRSLRVQFTALTFVNESEVRYRYRLLDLQQEWIETRQREIEYPGLTYGRYTFEVLARNAQGLWSQAPARFTFRILPPWWKVWWFQTLLVLMGTMAAVRIWQIRELRLLLQRQRLEAAVDARTSELVREKSIIDQQNREIERLLEQAHQASQAKSAFLANMSHEIRTPLNGVLGMIELARSTPLSGEQREYLDAAQESAGLLLSVLNGVLDLSRIEAGRLDLDPAPFSVRQLVAESVRVFEFEAEQKSLALVWEIDDAVPETLVGDSVRIRQVLLNLLGNAIKFTRKGSVSVRAALDPDQRAEGVRLRWIVADTGIGVPAEKRAVIFEAFRQADSSTTRKYGGSGLGLAISARLVELLGGRIWVESEPGQGSVFHFTALLQSDVRKAAAGPAKQVGDGSGKTPRRLAILLVEDNPVNQKVALRLLDKRGHSVTVAANGLEAVSLATSRDFDVILMDVHMPEMDGFEATRQIRNHQRQTGRTVPIIAMTACAMIGDREKCLEAGMDGYTEKPVDRARLVAAVEGAANPSVIPA